MFWPIFTYLVLSVAIAGSAGMHVGWAPALHAAGASFLAFSAGGGLRASLRGDRTQRIAGTPIALAVLALAMWVGTGFFAELLGVHVSGPIWVGFGFAVTFLFADRRLTGTRQSP